MDRRHICNICGDGFPRPRALRRHLDFQHHQKTATSGSTPALPYRRQNHPRNATPATTIASLITAHKPSSCPNDDLPTPPTCTIDIPAHDNSPTHNVIITASPPRTKHQTVATSPALPNQIAMQASSKTTQTDRITESAPIQPIRRLFTPERREKYLTFRTPPMPSVSIASHAQRQYLHLMNHTLSDSLFRICDCWSCVDHAIQLRKTVSKSGENNSDGKETSLRFTNLLHVGGRCSTNEEKKELVSRYVDQPERAHDVCSCTFCVTHQVLEMAGRHTRRLPHINNQPVYDNTASR